MERMHSAIHHLTIFAACHLIRVGALLAAVLAMQHTAQAQTAEPHTVNRLALESEIAGASAQDAASAAAAPPAGAAPSPQPVQINALILQLGSDRYAIRRRAEAALAQIGVDAFDPLQRATQHPDPEVAASAGYLLDRIRVDWADGAASKYLSRWLNVYSRYAEAERSVIAQRLIRAGAAAHRPLARIVRFDRSPLVSRTAAVVLLQPTERPELQVPLVASDIEPVLGNSERLAADWLRLHLSEGRDSARAAEAWREIAEREVQLLAQGSEETASYVVQGLFLHAMDIEHRLGHQDAVQDLSARMLRISATDFESRISQLLGWFTDRSAWYGIDMLVAQHRQTLESHASLAYLVAHARRRQGDEAEAAVWAERAAAEPMEGYFRLAIGRTLRQLGEFDWAKAEYQKILDEQPAADVPDATTQARYWLGELQHDLQEHAAAAASMAPINLESPDGQGPGPERMVQEAGQDTFRSYCYYYQSFVHESNGEWEQQRRALHLALRFEPDNPDILIAMYRARNTDEAWQADVARRIETMAQLFQQRIDTAQQRMEQNPHDPSALDELSQRYNHWAWLISNTEGDYQKAVEYSHASLDLRPNEAGLLDTLGRCYYAAGDFETAIKYQRQAVLRDPHYLVMQRQLALFERALAEPQE